ncbi:unnamed protein product [Hapterophycus canaliculatus]
MDEQPGHVARSVRDVTKVPLAKDLVKNNVGSTVKDQANSDFTIISQAESVAASARYLDPSLQPRFVSSPTVTSGAAKAAGKNDASSASDSSDGDTHRATGFEGKLTPDGQMGKAAARASSNEGPVVFMSDPDNYCPKPDRRKARKRGDCCVQ